MTATLPPIDRWRPPRLTCPVDPPALSRREAQMLVALCLGHTFPQIAERLGLSQNTIRTHVRLLYRKIGADNRSHAVALAYACRWQVTERPSAWTAALDDDGEDEA